MSWTPARVEILTQMWGEGATAAVIATKIGISRNAVIGKASRIGLAGRPNPIKQSDGTPKPVKPRKPKDPERQKAGLKGCMTIAANRATPRANRFAIRFGKVSACRWPEGDPKHADFHFCEAKTEPGRPYCQAHCERAYQKPEQESTRRMAAE